MTRFCAGLLAVAAIGVAAADDKKDDKKAPPLTGAWVKDDGAMVTLDFRSKDKLVITVQAGDNKIIATCKYEADKDGKVKGSITEIGGDAPEKPPVGLEFKLTITVDGDKAKVTDFDADGHDAAKAIMEGDYKKKKSD